MQNKADFAEVGSTDNALRTRGTGFTKSSLNFWEQILTFTGFNDETKYHFMTLVCCFLPPSPWIFQACAFRPSKAGAGNLPEKQEVVLPLNEARDQSSYETANCSMGWDPVSFSITRWRCFPSIIQISSFQRLSQILCNGEKNVKLFV